jgi:hypothetical protein
MKKIILTVAAAALFCSACNLNPKNDDEANTVQDDRPLDRAKNNIDRSMNGVNNNINNGAVNPQEIDANNTKVMYNGDEVMLNNLDNVIDDQLEKSNAGMNFKVVIVAEEDNTQ